MRVRARAAQPGDARQLDALAERAAAEVAGQRDGALHLEVEHGLAANGMPSRLTGGALAVFGIDDPARLRAVAEIDEVVVGFVDAAIVAGGDGGPICSLRAMYVEPDAREVGAGEALVELVDEWASEHGAVGIDAHALPGAREVKNFFESAGFVARLIVMHRRLDRR